MRRILRYAFGCAYCMTFAAILLIWGVFVIVVSNQSISSNNTSTSNTTSRSTDKYILNCFELLNYAVYDNACLSIDACFFALSNFDHRMIYINDTAHAAAHPCHNMWNMLWRNHLDYTSAYISAGIKCVERSYGVLSNHTDLTAMAGFGYCDKWTNEQPRCIDDDGKLNNVYVCND